MFLNDFMNVVRREARYGVVGTTNDQATLDILAEVNIRRKRIWKKADWPWALEQLATPLTASSQGPYSVLAKSGNLVDRITDLIPQDTTVTPPIFGPPLQEQTRQDFYAWSNTQIPVPDTPSKYINLGRNAAGQWQILLWPSPVQNFTLAGWAKKILTTFVLADVTGNTAFDYFPDGIVEDVLLDGVLAGVLRIQGETAMSERLDQAFEMKLKSLVLEQRGAGQDNSGVTSPPPDYWKWKSRARKAGGTTVV